MSDTGGGRPDAAQLALVGGHDAVEEVAGRGRWTAPARRPGSAAPAGPGDDPPRSEGCACRRRRGRRRASGGPAAPGPVRASGSRRTGAALEPVAADPTSTSDRAIESAPVHVPHDWSGDQCRGSSPWSRSTDPVGSNRRHRPSPDRAATVASSTSGLVDVDTTGPLLAITLGMINDVVLPERGGPRIMTECCGSDEAPTAAHCARDTPRGPRRLMQPTRRDGASWPVGGGLAKNILSTNFHPVITSYGASNRGGPEVPR